MSVPAQTILAFHGSGTRIERFDYQFTDQGNDQLGSGFYFTTDRAEAEGYATATINGLDKLGGDDAPTVHSVELRIKSPLPAEKTGALSARQVGVIIRAAPDLETALENWGDVDFEGRDKVLRQAIGAYTGIEAQIIKTLNHLAVDFYPGAVEAFNRAVTKTLGYDGVVVEFENKTHYVAWYPEQITLLEAIPYAAPQVRSIRPHP